VSSGKGTASVYIVQMLDDPVVAYDGGQPGLAATRPAPGEHVDPNSASVRRYQNFLDRTHADALASAGASANAKFYDYRFSFNGFAAVLQRAQAARLAAAERRGCNVDERRELLTDNTPTDLGLTGPGGFWETAGNGETLSSASSTRASGPSTELLRPVRLRLPPGQ
jgi:hypothetical protein